MIAQDALLVTLVKLVNQIPMPPPPPKRGRGHPKVYSDWLFLKALVIMIARHLHRVHELLAVLGQPTPEMQTLRALLTEKGRYPWRRTWQRRLKALPTTLPAQMAAWGVPWLPLSSRGRTAVRQQLLTVPCFGRRVASGTTSTDSRA